MVDYLYIVDEEEYHDGRVVVKEGGHGKWIWVVLEGTVTVTKDTPKGSVTLARLGEGSYIGSFTSLLFQDLARSATATAEGDVRLGLLDTQRLAEVRVYRHPASYQSRSQDESHDGPGGGMLHEVTSHEVTKRLRGLGAGRFNKGRSLCR
jgi:CRP-like cAMP-binding protein